MSRYLCLLEERLYSVLFLLSPRGSESFLPLSLYTGGTSIQVHKEQALACYTVHLSHSLSQKLLSIKKSRHCCCCCCMSPRVQVTQLCAVQMRHRVFRFLFLSTSHFLTSASTFLLRNLCLLHFPAHAYTCALTVSSLFNSLCFCICCSLSPTAPCVCDY